MLPLSPEQQQVLDRFDAKATSMGLTRVGDLTWYWSRVYLVAGHDQVTIGCSCDPNIKDSPMRPIVMVPVPSKTKYAKYEHRTYGIDEFEKLNGQKLIELSNQVQAQANEIAVLEANLKELKVGLNKYAKKAVSDLT
jgi:hypothetical protein